MGARVAFAGRLEHAELAELLPAAEAMAVTSTFPEAFGMVAAEGAAAGVLPIVAAPSRLAQGGCPAYGGGPLRSPRGGAPARRRRAAGRASVADVHGRAGGGARARRRPRR